MSSFQAGNTKLERFLPSNQHTQRKSLNFENWCSGELSKNGHHFCNFKIDVIKNDNNNKCAPKLVLYQYCILQWKKNQKNLDDFCQRKLTLKVKFWHFWQLTATPILQIWYVISFDYSWFWAKNLSNFVFLLWKLHNRYCHNGETGNTFVPRILFFACFIISWKKRKEKEMQTGKRSTTFNSFQFSVSNNVKR